jgi:hypothetical protein
MLKCSIIVSALIAFGTPVLAWQEHPDVQVRGTLKYRF